MEKGGRWGEGKEVGRRNKRAKKQMTEGQERRLIGWPIFQTCQVDSHHVKGSHLAHVPAQ